MTQQRAAELIELNHWETLSCLHRERPDIPAMTEPERLEIQQRWLDMPSWATRYDALNNMRKGIV